VVARDRLRDAAHGEAEGGGGCCSSATSFQWKLEGRRWSRSFSRLRVSLCKRWLGRRWSGVGCPRAGGARPERKQTAAAECSSGTGFWTLGLAKQQVGVDVVLLRARERELRHCSELATTARRWRPETARVAVARAREATRGEERSRDWEERTRGELWQLEVALGARDRRRAAVAGAAQRGKRRGQRRKKQRAVRRTSL
jgi:hypothetical protein